VLPLISLNVCKGPPIRQEIELDDKIQPKRHGFVLRCIPCDPRYRPRGNKATNGCGRAFAVNVRRNKGQWPCPHCQHRIRADLQNGGSAAVVVGPMPKETAIDYAINLNGGEE